MKTLIACAIGACIVASSGAAQAALIDRGGGLIYDTDLNVTWLANANLASSETFGVTGIWGDGFMDTWYVAQNWIAAMNAANYLGYSDWRLPSAGTCTTSGCVGGEMSHLFYNELGGVQWQSIADTHNANYNLFQNIETTSWTSRVPDGYWTGTNYPNYDLGAWVFSFGVGTTSPDDKDGHDYYAWAVRTGDVASSPIPLPAAAWLLGSGLMGLMALGRARRLR